MRKRLAFKDTTLMLTRRIQLMLSLPLHKIDALSLQHELRDIGKR